MGLIEATDIFKIEWMLFWGDLDYLIVFLNDILIIGDVYFVSIWNKLWLYCKDF